MLGGDLDRAARQNDKLIEQLGSRDHSQWWQKLPLGDAWLARGTVARAAGQPAVARTAFETAQRLFEQVVAANDLPHYVRRLERARAELGARP
jgi:hypothetical protein